MTQTKKPNYLLYAFLLNLLAGIFAFGWTIIDQGGLFSLAGDFNVQQIPFAMYANDAIKSGNVIWDYSLDLGSNFIGGMAFYILGNPSFWVSLLFPSKYFMYIVGWLYVLKYAFAGMTSYAFMRRYVKHQEYAVISSMLYAFSGFMAEALLFYHFHDVVVLFPLMMMTFDDLMQDKKKGPFIIAVFFNAIVNYFFIIGEIVFLAIYFFVRYFFPDIKKGFRRMRSALVEGVIGCGLGAALLVPAFIFTIQNPRVQTDYTGSAAILYNADRYLYILKGVLFPGEVMSDQSCVIRNNFSTCNAYMPMVGMILAIAFVMLHKKHWLSKMLKISLIMALVPILNAVYSLFAGVYCRWYYMPILMMTLASALVMDEWEEEKQTLMSPTPVQKRVRNAAIIYGCIAVAFVCFLMFVPWSDKTQSIIYRYDVFTIWTAVCLAGVLLTYFIFCRMNKRRMMTLCLFIYIFSIGTTAGAIVLYQIAHGQDARHIYDRLMTSAQFNDYSPEYRWTNRDNTETLTHGFAAEANFCSTVSGSIFRFYSSLGLSRDVKSPDAPDGLDNLISAKYTYETEARKDEDPVQVVRGDYVTYYVYANNSVPPVGFTYDTYMTQTEFKAVNVSYRAIMMLKTLVIPDEDEAIVSTVLRHYDAQTDGEATTEYLNKISADHLEECSQDFHSTTSSFGSTIIAKANTYAFYSIPNDSGWSATVNGEEVEIMDINGFMAVPISAGTNDIEFSYHVPGLGTGIIMTLGCVLLAAVYIYLAKKRGKRKVMAAAGGTMEIGEAADSGEMEEELQVKEEAEETSGESAGLTDEPYGTGMAEEVMAKEDAKDPWDADDAPVRRHDILTAEELRAKEEAEEDSGELEDMSAGQFAAGPEGLLENRIEAQTRRRIREEEDSKNS